MLMGTHRAEHPRPRRLGQASSAVLSGNTMVRALDAAGQSSGDMTPQPASSAWAVLTSTCRKWALLESARSSSDRMPGAAWLRASATRSKTDGFGLGHFQCGLQAGLEGDPLAMSDCTASQPGLLHARPEVRVDEDRDHGAGDGQADGNGPQEVDPGTVGRGLRLIGRRVERDGDGGLQRGKRRVEVGGAAFSAAASCVVCAVCGSPARKAPRVICAAT